MLNKIIGAILGILSIQTLWTAIKMFLSLWDKNKRLEVSYSPLPLYLTNPNHTLIVISAIVYLIITIIFAMVSLKIFKN